MLFLRLFIRDAMGFVTLPVVGVFSSLLQLGLVSSSDGATSLILSVSDSDAT